MNGAITSTPPYVFKAWCLIKRRHTKIAYNILVEKLEGKKDRSEDLGVDGRIMFGWTLQK
jgi:hypothetical protein